MLKQFITPTHNDATTPLPECSMLKNIFMGGVAKYTWFTQPLCKCVLDGNIGPRGREGELLKTLAAHNCMQSCCELVSVNSPKNEVLGIMQKTYRVANDAHKGNRTPPQDHLPQCYPVIKTHEHFKNPPLPRCIKRGTYTCPQVAFHMCAACLAPCHLETRV